ncbi:MAG: tryptophan synthase subunit alpha [Desulfonatronovibrionaceae bacterium]
MNGHQALHRAIKKANQKKRPALIPFLPAGYPQKSRFWDLIHELDSGGADIIEIGVPFSDPVADGPVVEEASIACLEQGIDLEWILQGLTEQAEYLSAPVVLMGYSNPFYQYGLKGLAQDAAQAGVSGFIVPDLPLEELPAFEGLQSSAETTIIPLIGLNTTAGRMKAYAELDPAFVYTVSVMGTTGTKAGASSRLKSQLALAREIFDCPLALGFGIENKDQIRDLGVEVQAVVFGSALIRHIRQGKSVKEFMRAWTE